MRIVINSCPKQVLITLIGHNKRTEQKHNLLHTRMIGTSAFAIKLELQHLAAEVIPTFLHTATEPNLVLFFYCSKPVKDSLLSAPVGEHFCSKKFALWRHLRRNKFVVFLCGAAKANLSYVYFSFDSPHLFQRWKTSSRQIMIRGRRGFTLFLPWTDRFSSKFIMLVVNVVLSKLFTHSCCWKDGRCFPHLAPYWLFCTMCCKVTMSLRNFIFVPFGVTKEMLKMKKIAEIYFSFQLLAEMRCGCEVSRCCVIDFASCWLT